MINLTFDTGCRSCLRSNNIRNAYSVMDSIMADYMIKTEFEIVQQIENWRLEDKLGCPFCGSDNVEISGLVAEDYEEKRKLYDYDYLVYKTQNENSQLWQLNLNKRNNLLSPSEGGRSDSNPSFVEGCLDVLSEVLDSISDEKFELHERGLFFACFTGKYKSTDRIKGYSIKEGFTIKLESLTYHGITKSEILNAINQYRLQYRR